MLCLLFSVTFSCFHSGKIVPVIWCKFFFNLFRTATCLCLEGDPTAGSSRCKGMEYLKCHQHTLPVCLSALFLWAGFHLPEGIIISPFIALSAFSCLLGRCLRRNFSVSEKVKEIIFIFSVGSPHALEAFVCTNLIHHCLLIFSTIIREGDEILKEKKRLSLAIPVTFACLY